MKLVNEKELREKLSISNAEFESLIQSAKAIEKLNVDYANGENGVDSESIDSKMLPWVEILRSLRKQNSIPRFYIQHDPRGPAVRLFFDDGSYNTWGGEEHGFGILFEEGEN